MIHLRSRKMMLTNHWSAKLLTEQHAISDHGMSCVRVMAPYRDEDKTQFSVSAQQLGDVAECNTLKVLLKLNLVFSCVFNINQSSGTSTENKYAWWLYCKATWQNYMKLDISMSQNSWHSNGLQRSWAVPTMSHILLCGNSIQIYTLLLITIAHVSMHMSIHFTFINK